MIKKLINIRTQSPRASPSFFHRARNPKWKIRIRRIRIGSIHARRPLITAGKTRRDSRKNIYVYIYISPPLLLPSTSIRQSDQLGRHKTLSSPRQNCTLIELTFNPDRERSLHWIRSRPVDSSTCKTVGGRIDNEHLARSLPFLAGSTPFCFFERLFTPVRCNPGGWFQRILRNASGLGDCIVDWIEYWKI